MGKYMSEKKQTEQAAAGTAAAEQKTDEQILPRKTDGEREMKRMKRAERDFRDVQSLLLQIFMILTALYLMFHFVFGLLVVPSQDMKPRLDAGDLLVYYRLDREPSAGDVICFEKNGTTYAGRVAAVGGDTVEITEEETLKVNGSVMIEQEIFYPTPRYEGFTDYPLEVPAGAYFILSDFREGGEDSRYFGCVEKSEILGTVIMALRRGRI
jgi:signal peptidase I